MTHTIRLTTTLMSHSRWNSQPLCFHGVASFCPAGSTGQILLALESNSCHNIIKLEQKFMV